jgi:hypothetical protein
LVGFWSFGDFANGPVSCFLPPLGPFTPLVPRSDTDDFLRTYNGGGEKVRRLQFGRCITRATPINRRRVKKQFPINNLMARLGIFDVPGLVRFALQFGLIARES